MRTFSRVCIEDHVITALNGDSMTVHRGREYITSPLRSDGTVVVYGGFWVPFPARLFAGERVFTEGVGE